MVFKLVRTDIEDPCKIQLPLGVHLIGRGKFLDCDDKRVSRKHGELEVTDDAVNIKALHQNPCFYTKKGTEDIQILKLNNSVTLTNGDKFGLLPNACWYEIIHCSTDIVREEDATQMTESIETSSTIIVPTVQNSSEKNELGNETLVRQRSESPSLLPEADLLTEQPTCTHDEPNQDVVEKGEAIKEKETVGQPEPATSLPIVPQTTSNNIDIEGPSNQAEDEVSPKRCHSPEETDNVKRVKTEPPDNDSAPQAGPSSDRGNTSNANDGGTDNAVGGQPQSPAKPAANQNGPGRERCMYGANCYRKNPAHKAQFSHPSDGDWGAGERGACPWGRGCNKRDPRHWRDHDHPPGTQPPAAPRPKPRKQQNVVKRQRSLNSDEESPESDSGAESPKVNLIVPGKRTRKTIKRTSWSGSEDEVVDPFGTDESDEWTPGSENYTQSQDI